MRYSRYFMILLFLIIVGALSGCKSNDPPPPSDTSKQFFNTLYSDNPDSACQYLDLKAATQISALSAMDCSSGMLLFKQDFETRLANNNLSQKDFLQSLDSLTRVTDQTDQSALLEVDLKEPFLISMIQENNAWKINNLSVTPVSLENSQNAPELLTDVYEQISNKGKYFSSSEKSQALLKALDVSVVTGFKQVTSSKIYLLSCCSNQQSLMLATKTRDAIVYLKALRGQPPLITSTE